MHEDFIAEVGIRNIFCLPLESLEILLQCFRNWPMVKTHSPRVGHTFQFQMTHRNHHKQRKLFSGSLHFDATAAFGICNCTHLHLNKQSSCLNKALL